MAAHLYFEASAAVIALVRVGKWLEAAGAPRRWRGHPRAGRSAAGARPGSPGRGRHEFRWLELRRRHAGDPFRRAHRRRRHGADGLAASTRACSPATPARGETAGCQLVGGSLNGEALLLVRRPRLAPKASSRAWCAWSRSAGQRTSDTAAGGPGQRGVRACRDRPCRRSP